MTIVHKSQNTKKIKSNVSEEEISKYAAHTSNKLCSICNFTFFFHSKSRQSRRSLSPLQVFGIVALLASSGEEGLFQSC